MEQAIGERALALPGRRAAAALLLLMALSACETGLDLGLDGGFNLRGDIGPQTAPRPEPDARGVITYPNYQVVVARRGDTVADLAARIGLGAEELARHNGLAVDYRLREGELLALPRKVAPGSGVDIAAIAGNAISAADRRSSGTGPPPPEALRAEAQSGVQTGVEPIRHRVERGETAYSIARLYDVSVTALASWNGLGPDLAVRAGQQLLIPVVENPAPQRRAEASRPGAGSATPTPPSASKPLPEKTETAALPPSPELGQFRSDEGGRKFLRPVAGKVISPYSGKQGGNEGIDIAASPGTAVKAAEDGEVALVSKSVGAGTIVLIRHADNIYTVYSNISNVTLAKGQKVRRGQRIGVVSEGSPSYLHFEVRRGTESVDPEPFL